MKDWRPFFIVAGVILVGFGVFAASSFFGEKTPTVPPTSVDGTEAFPDTIPGSPGVAIEWDESETVVPTIAAPDLSREPQFAAHVLPEARTRAGERIAELQESLRGQTDDFTSWLELGLTFSSIGDYEGARLSYEYAAALRPGSSVVYGNLGFLHGWYLKEPLKAETSYKTAIANDPSQEYLQIQLFELYRDIFKDAARARAFAEERIKESPDFALTFTLLITELDRTTGGEVSDGAGISMNGSFDKTFFRFLTAFLLALIGGFGLLVLTGNLREREGMRGSASETSETEAQVELRR